MDRAAVAQYLARAHSARSVRELHAVVRAVRATYPADPDAASVEQACWDAALRLVAATAGVKVRPHRVDWKERAASA